ncbi:hypothetical protein WV31_10590 [Magnetospirillum sp. ME-1]|uniref:hypothetical protein n=1 Tax=Magnetospirillum sp. ME-1 TaxID=1639348 RepID=UPI000A17AECD|nr:hypothetical protein [Magnetospirillum sp. ME-1]ARJ66075.1 hypothetical protein WV31_10590 [Magnetospirillum sp. ME-1]
MRKSASTDKPGTAQEIARRLGLMKHATDSASLEGVQIDERTKGWLEDFAHGRLSEQEVIRRIKSDA